MEQLNNNLPLVMEEHSLVVENSFEGKENSILLNKVRQKFILLGGVSLSYGVAFAFLFYRADFGLNMFLFSLVTITLLLLLMNKLLIPLKRKTYYCYLVVILFGLSCMFTASEILQLINVTGMLLMLDLSIVHQMHEDHTWDISKFLKRILLLPFSCVTTLNLPILDCYNYLKKCKLFHNKKVFNVFLGIVISIPVLMIVVALLMSADLLFKDLTKELVSSIFSPDILILVGMMTFGFLACYSVMCGASAIAGIQENCSIRKKADASIAITFLTILCLVYVMFCGIQILYLFSKGFFVLPDQFTYSEYARRGFFELVAVTAINIILMLICTTRFSESKVIRFLLSCMTACTYIMIGSAFYRMMLYITEYQLTFLRVFVLLLLCLDAFILAGIILSVYIKGFPLFWYCIIVTSLGFLFFSFAKPDYIIASYNIEYDMKLEYEDILYLTEELSFDAATKVVPLLKTMCEMNQQYNGQGQIDKAQDDWIYRYQKDYIDYIKSQASRRGVRDFNFSYLFAVEAAIENN